MLARAVCSWLIALVRSSSLPGSSSPRAYPAEGIQAQTLSVYHHAVEADLTLLPVINKVDLPHADPAAASREIASSLGLPVETHMRISAKSGLGVEIVLGNIVENLPAPDEWEGGDRRLRGLVFDTLCVSPIAPTG